MITVEKRSSGVLFGMPWLSPIVIPDGTFSLEELKIFTGFYFISTDTVIEKVFNLSLKICDVNSSSIRIIDVNNVKVTILTTLVCREE